MFQRLHVLCLCLLLAGCRDLEPADVAPSPAPILPPVLIHLPGVAGPMAVDRTLVAGLVRGGVAAQGETFDWNAGRRGLPALNDYAGNIRQAERLAAHLTELYRADPRRRITLAAHSGGTAVAVWALERLPPDVRIDHLVMLASALSPTYDLSPALRHVRGGAVAFHSQHDREVLGLGTRLFGTMDRKHTPAAGYAGFTPPPAADARAYARLTQYAYDLDWRRHGHYGDHIGMMETAFAARVIAPMIAPMIAR